MNTYFIEEKGFIEVGGAEAVQFLNGLITNDVKKLAENETMLAAFPNVQGRIVAFARVLNVGGKFLFITDKKTHSAVYQNLFRFTFAGDFQVEDVSEKFALVAVRGAENEEFPVVNSSENTFAEIEFEGEQIRVFRAYRSDGNDYVVPCEKRGKFIETLQTKGLRELSEDEREVLRVESGLPEHGVDLDETNVVLESGLAEAVSFQKGCYVGQEIIARIHFRGHVAKQLSGLILDDDSAKVGDELQSAEGKSAGKITSIVYSHKFGKNIALAIIRYEFLKAGTRLTVVGKDVSAKVVSLPFVVEEI